MPRSLSRNYLPLACAVVACTTPAPAPERIAPIPASEVQFRREVFRNERVTAFLLELPPNQATLMHRHDRDIASVFVNGGRTIGTFEGRQPALDTFSPGDVRFRTAGFTHATHNVGSEVFRSVILELAEPQGPAEKSPSVPSESCSTSESSCVERLFCTAKMCAARVSVAPRAVWRRTVDNDELIVAITDVELADTERISIRMKRSSGEVGPALPSETQVWRNVGPNRAGFIVVTFR